MRMRQAAVRMVMAWMGAALMLSSAHAAKLVAPPSQQLETDENIVAIVTVVSKATDDQLNIKAEQVLHGEAFTVEKVRFDKSFVAQAKPGDSYLLAYSWLTKNPLTRGRGWVKNSEGPVVVGFTEVSQAVFPPDASLVNLLALSDEPDTDSARIDICLQLLTREDHNLRYFAGLELLLNNRLASAYMPAQRDQLQKLMASSGYAPEHRDLMYRVALQLPLPLQADWLASQARTDLQALGNQYDLASRLPSLAKVATQALRDHGAASDAPLLTMLLRSNAPGVAKMALHALAAKANAAAETAIAEALADQSLPAESRRVFEIYRKNGKLPG